jgi:CRISPR-associated protein Cas2
MIEVRAGVYLGMFSAHTRKMIWNQVVDGLTTGDAVMAWTDASEQGFSFMTIGENRRVSVNLDGLNFVSFEPLGRETDVV